MGTKIDQKAYLQKYLGGPSNDKKKKKKRVVKGKGLKIIDDDVDLSKLRPLDGDELDILDQGEDAPQIAGIIDERPEEVKKAELFNMSSKWRVINQDDGFNSKLEIEEIKKDIKQQEKENELIFGKMYSDSEDEQTNKQDNKQSKRQSDKSDSDFSPPRRSDNRESPPNTRQDSDQSPPRRNETRKERTRPSRWGVAEESRHTPDSDLSPPRKSRKHKGVSPERHKSNRNRLGESPQTKKIHKQSKNVDVNSNSDTERRRNGSSRRDNKRSDKHKRKEKIRKDSDSDLSPPRKNKRNVSPPLKKSKVPSSERKYNDSDSDLSPPRRDRAKNKDSKRNSSSPEKRNNEGRSSKKYYENPNRNNNKYADRRRDNSTKDRRRDSESPPPSNKKMARTLEGKMAGLQEARQLREENEAFRKREEDAFKRLGDEVSGRNARAVARKSKRETSEERRKQMEKAERQKEIDEKYRKWGKGLKQLEAQEARVQDFIHEASKPLARYKDDEDLEQRLRNEERQGDPMLKYVKDKKRERGEVGPEKPSYRGSFPPNRFNIRPGYRWDGVDRSNGYEKKYFEQQSKRRAQEEEAYKWSTEDL